MNSIHTETRSHDKNDATTLHLKDFAINLREEQRNEWLLKGFHLVKDKMKTVNRIMQRSRYVIHSLKIVEYGMNRALSKME